MVLRPYSRLWYQENSIKSLLNCVQLLMLQYMVCALLSHGYSSDSSSDPINPLSLSNQSMENLVYNLRYGSAGLFSISKSKSSLSFATTSTILGVSSSFKYILYSSSMGSSYLMTSSLTSVAFALVLIQILPGLCTYLLCSHDLLECSMVT